MQPIFARLEASPRLGEPGPAGTARGPAWHLDTLAARGVLRTFHRGMLLIEEGDHSNTLCIVRSGQLRAFLANPAGKELTLGIYGPGDYVGEMALDGGPRSASVEALELSICAIVTRETLLAYIGECPDFAFDILARVIRRARLATESSRSLALIDVWGRFTRLLDQLAGPALADGSRVIPQRLTQGRIASHLACSRATVSRMMRELEKCGHAQVRHQQIVLLKQLPARW